MIVSHYNRNKTFFVIISILLFCISCKENNKQLDDATKIVNEWTGKTIQFPNNLYCTSMGENYPCIDLYSDKYKILLYVDSLGCTSCHLKLSEWKRIMAESDSLFSRKIEFILFFQPKKVDKEELQIIFKENEFNHPVFIDQNIEIDKLNKFPSKIEYQCFLIDNDNRVIAIGNPSLNHEIWILYKKIIEEKMNENNIR